MRRAQAVWPLTAIFFAASVIVSVPLQADTTAPTLVGQGYSGDFNGDGKHDVANFDPGSDTWNVGISTGSEFSVTEWGDYAAAEARWVNRVGDFNGDGKDDVFSFKDGAGSLIVGLSTGTGFTVDKWQDTRFKTNWQTFLAGDFNGDEADDIAGYHEGTGVWHVFVSTRQAFDPAVAWARVANTSGSLHLRGDFDGDNRTDIATFDDGRASWKLLMSTGTGFRVLREKLEPSSGWSRRRTADFNGDGRTDIAHFFTGAEWHVSISDGSGFSTTKWADLARDTGWGAAVTGDFNGDNLDDVATFLRPRAEWFVGLTSGASFTTSSWIDMEPDEGWARSHEAGDFDGDGLTDIASFHVGSGHWWVSRSNGSAFIASDWNPGNVPPQARFKVECSGFDCIFRDISTDNDGSIASRLWDFGDGRTASGREEFYSYAEAGDYTVTLTVTDDDGATDTESRVITVREADTSPTVRFSVRCDLLECTFRDESVDNGTLESFTWDFGDGRTGRGRRVTHRYSTGGSYTITHTATDDEGLTGSARRTIDVLTPHKRVVRLDLIHIQGYLYARGRIGVRDGFGPCRAGRDVIIQKKRAGRWVNVLRGRSNNRGRYFVPLYYQTAPHDRPGTYRVKAPRERPANRPYHVCLLAHSGSRTHLH